MISLGFYAKPRNHLEPDKEFDEKWEFLIQATRRRQSGLTDLPDVQCVLAIWNTFAVVSGMRPL